MIRKKRSQILQFFGSRLLYHYTEKRGDEFHAKKQCSLALVFYELCVYVLQWGKLLREICVHLQCAAAGFPAVVFPVYLSCLSSPQVIVCIQPVVHNVIGCCQLSAAFSCFQLACAITHLHSPRVTLFIIGYMYVNLKVKG